MTAVLESFGLCKSFGSHRAVVDVTLRIALGETFGFLGENGAGKSTFVQMICGVIAPDQGEIALFQRRAKRVPPSWRAEIGYVAQEPRFDPWMTAVELGVFLKPFFPTHDRDLFSSLLARLDVPTKQRIETLSVGQRARLATAAALAHRPALLILDEPTAGLDPLARRELHRLLQETAAEHPRATFFSSHIVDDVEHLATRIGVLDRGRLIYDGTPTDLGEGVRVIDTDDEKWLSPRARVLARKGETLIVLATRADWASFSSALHFDAPPPVGDDGVAAPPPPPRHPTSRSLGLEEGLVALLASRVRPSRSGSKP